MNFDSNNQRSNFEPRYAKNIHDYKRTQKPSFEYKQGGNNHNRKRDRGLFKGEAQRRVINIESKVEESKISYVFKELSSYDK